MPPSQDKGLGPPGLEAAARYALGTRFSTRGKHPRICTVVDYWLTRNLAGEVVRRRYVATYEFCGQTVTDYDVVEPTIALGLMELASPLPKQEGEG